MQTTTPATSFTPTVPSPTSSGGQDLASMPLLQAESYGSTGLIPSTSPTTTSKPLAVVSSDSAKENIQTQKGVVNDILLTTAQNKAVQSANPQVSIVDALGAQGKPTDFNSRAALAASMGITNYTGTASQNAQMIANLQNQGTQTTKTDNTTGASTTTTQGTVQNIPAGMVPLYANGSAVSDGNAPVGYRDPKTGTDTMLNQTTAPGTQNQQAQKQLDTSLNEWQKAYDTYNDTIQQIFAGTFLTPSQQASVQATSATFDRIRTAQADANAKYQKLREQASFVGGQNVTDPNQYVAQKQAVIQSGLDKIAAIDAAADKALNELKESFADKNAKRANDAYSTLKDYLKEKNTLIQKSKDDALALEKDIREWNFKIDNEEYNRTQDTIKNEREAEKLADDLLTSASARETAVMNREKLAWDIKKIKSDISAANVGNDVIVGNGGQNVPYIKALQSATFGLPENQRVEAMGIIKSYLASGDFKSAQEYITRAATKNMPGTAQEDALRRLEALESLKDVKTELNKYVEKSGDTNLASGSMQKVLTKLGNTTDPELVKIRTQITQSLQQYRNAVTGAAWGVQEDDEYRSIFPDISNTNKLNTAIIDSMVNVLDRNQRIRIGSAVGMSSYDQIFNPNIPKASDDTLSDYYQSSPDAAAKVDALVAENPNLSADDILQILEP